MNTLEAARDYKRRDWAPIPVPFKEKNPGFEGWEETLISEEDLPRHFNGKSQNIGALLGRHSSNLTDVDLDRREAVQVAPYFLQRTRIFGRDSNPSCHWLYVTDRPLDTKRYQVYFTKGGKRRVVTFAELRGNGAQTIMPPSVHPSGEAIRFENDLEPLQVGAERLSRQVQLLAVAAMVLHVWPGEKGARHDIAMALAGGLLRAHCTVEEAETIIRAAAECRGDDEVEDRVKVVRYTKGRLDGGLSATGWNTLKDLVGKTPVQAMQRWLDYRPSSAAPEIDILTNGQIARLQFDENTPHFPEDVFPALPRTLREGAALYGYSRRERDAFLCGALPVLSGGLPCVYGRYGTKAKPYSPHIYVFVLASGGGGKDAMNDARDLGEVVHERVKQQSEEARKEWFAKKEAFEEARREARKSGTEPEVEDPGPEPPLRRLFFAGNSSARGLQDNFSHNQRGIIVSSELDAITTASKQEWGNFSYMWRQAYGHETIEFARKGENVEVKDPALSLALSGTPEQFPAFMEGGVENGMFSRGLYYTYLPDPSWRDITPAYRETWPEDVRAALARDVDALSLQLEARQGRTLWIDPTPEQYELLNQFGDLSDEGFAEFGYAWLATARRMGLNCFRMIQTLTVLRAFEAGVDLSDANALVPEDEDVAIAFQLAQVFAEHVKGLFRRYDPNTNPDVAPDKRDVLFGLLPDVFGFEELKQAAADMSISTRTAYRYLNEWKKQGRVKSRHGEHRKQN